MEGLYINEKSDLIRLIRFYDDGFVLGVFLSSSNYESKGEVTSWFSREKYDALWSKGNYTLGNERVATLNYISISFDLYSKQNKVRYSGHIINSEEIYLCFDKELTKNKTGEEGFHWPTKEDFENLTFKKLHSDYAEKIDLERYQGYLGLMIKLAPAKLFEEFGQQYIIENSRDKFEKISNIVRKSDEIKAYIHNLKLKSSKPNPEDLQLLMNSHSYFKWAKEETICLGALGVIYIWANSSYKPESGEIVNKIMASLIDYSSKLKYNQFDNFFHRFYRRLKLTIDSN